MLLRIHHETKLTYTEPVFEHVFEVRMAPSSDEDQTSLGYRLRMTPATPVTPYRDGFSNRVDLFNMLSPGLEVVVRATTVVRTHRRDGRVRLAATPWSAERPIAVEALEFLHCGTLTGPSPALEEFMATLPEPSGTMLDVVEGLMAAVHDRLKYEKKVTTAMTQLHEVLAIGRGVCQDFAHLFIGACHGLGLPARYVSGYVHGPGELATHAWAQVWNGNDGWVDVDPTHNLVVGDDHVVTAVGRDFADVPPNRGVWKGDADETINVSVNVEPIERMPLDWGEWVAQSAWAEATWRQAQRKGWRPLGLTARAGYRQQQSQQQQIGGR